MSGRRRRRQREREARRGGTLDPDPDAEREEEEEAMAALLARGKTLSGVGSSCKWQPVEVTDAVIFGFDQAGFGGLQTLDYADLDPEAQALLAADGADGADGAAQPAGGRVGAPTAEAGAGGEDAAPAKKRKGRKKDKKASEAEATAVEGTGDRSAATEAAATAREGGEEGAKAGAEAGLATKGKGKGKKTKAQRRMEKKQQARNATAAATASAPAAAESEPAPAATPVDLPAWAEFGLPAPILRALADSGFNSPTAIQKATLPPALGVQCDILAAAETGSGKTLGFALPILTRLLREEEEAAGTKAEAAGAEAEAAAGAGDVDVEGGKRLRALILTPTRELALQVQNHIKGMCTHTSIKAVAIVGGLALPKQKRLLQGRPEIVVGTPGRLWELIAQGHPHFVHLSHLDFLVIDEADRMVDKGHFQELDNILSLLPKTRAEEATRGQQRKRHRHRDPQPDTDADAAVEGDMEVNDGDEDGTEGANTTMDLNIEADKEAAAIIGDGNVSGLLPREAIDYTLDAADLEAAERRQTFIFSATLTLNPKTKGRAGSHKKKKRKKGGTVVEAIIEKCGLREGYQVIDLTVDKAKLASGLLETRITCVSDEKDAYLCYFLYRYPGRTLVFVNSIACIKRLSSVLRVLDLTPLCLHASMQQRQRLKNLDRFRDQKSAVMIATDVAARGLDIKGIEHVIHYEVPRKTELYVHRSGRTARLASGGLSVMIIGPKDMSHYKNIIRNLNRDTDVPNFPVNLHFIPPIQARLSLASKIEREENKHRRAKRNNDWFQKAAAELEIDLDDDLLETFEEPDNVRHTQAQRLDTLKADLARLMARPIRPAGGRGFVSGQGALPSAELLAADKDGEALRIAQGRAGHATAELEEGQAEEKEEGKGEGEAVATDPAPGKRRRKRRRKRRAEDDA